MKARLYILTTIALILACGFSAQARAERLRVLTFDTGETRVDESGPNGWEARKAAAAKTIRKHKPDIIGLQETTPERKASFMKYFPEYQIIDRSAKPGIVDETLSHNDNPILFRADRFELLDYGYFWLDSAISGNTPESPEARHATWVKLRFRKSGKIFFYFNVRLSPEGKAARGESSKLLADKVKAIAGDNAVAFMGGDFAMNPGTKLMKPLDGYMAEAQLSLRKTYGKSSFNGFGKGPDGNPDHILYRNARLESFKVLDGPRYGVTFISDHYPVMSDFAIPRKK